MIAVSNASPFFEKICIPEGVDREISEKDDEAYKRVRGLIEREFIEVLPVKNKDLVKILNSELGVGESEAIVLCREIKANYVLEKVYKKLKSIEFWVSRELFSSIFE